MIVSPATRRAIERHIALQDPHTRQAQGHRAAGADRARALHAFEIAQDDRRGVGRAQLVGREQAHDRRGRAALSSSGRIVALAGEAGAGKTRLIEDALQRMVLLSADSQSGMATFFPYSVECQSYEQNTAYAVLRELLRQFFNLHWPRSQPSNWRSSSGAWTSWRPSWHATPLLGDLLGTAFDDTPLTAALTPEQRHDRAQELVEALILAEARARPLVLIIDDLHWADASSLDLLGRLVRRAPEAPLLLLLGYRMDPPIAEPWRDLAYCERIEVRELSPRAAPTSCARCCSASRPPS